MTHITPYNQIENHDFNNQKQNNGAQLPRCVASTKSSRTAPSKSKAPRRRTKTWMGPNGGNPTWRIIPVSKWVVTPIYKPFRPFGRGTSLVRGLINHGYQLLTNWDDPPSIGNSYRITLYSDIVGIEGLNKTPRIPTKHQLNTMGTRTLGDTWGIGSMYVKLIWEWEWEYMGLLKTWGCLIWPTKTIFHQHRFH